MEQTAWVKLKKWLADHGQTSPEVANCQEAVNEVEAFYDSVQPFPGWQNLTLADGNAYLAALSREQSNERLRNTWSCLEKVSDGLIALHINNNQPFNSIRLFATWLHDERQYSAATVRAYSTDLNDCQATLQKSGVYHQWDQINADDVSTYLGALRKRQLKQSTILRKLSSLHTFYQFLEQNHLVKANPWAMVMMKRQPAALPRYLYPPEIKILLQTARGNGEPIDLRNIAIVEVLLQTGMRVAELVHLKMSDIDQNLKLILVNGKGGKQRYLPLDSSLNKTLLNYVKNCRQPLISKSHQSHQFVFINQHGGPLTTAGVTYILNQLIQKSSLTGKIHPHMLRHTFATTMLNNGADIRSVQELLGHASLSTTQVYTHVTSKYLQTSYRRYFSRARKDHSR